MVEHSEWNEMKCWTPSPVKASFSEGGGCGGEAHQKGNNEVKRWRGDSAALIKQQAIVTASLTDYPPHRQLPPADTSWAPSFHQHAMACHMFTEAPSHRLSHIKYASAGADGKAVTSEAPVWVSCFCEGYRDAATDRGKEVFELKNALTGTLIIKTTANKNK